MSLRINTDTILSWKIATKTQAIKAKPLISIMVDKGILSKFLIDTLEGKEPLGDGVVICLGQSMDVWQQSPKKLLQKYDVVSLDNDGWMDCQPRPDNAVECFQVQRSFIDAICMEQGGWFGKFSIIGLWGETIGEVKNIQVGHENDYICRNRSDTSDVWIVKQNIFENTYSIKN